jgi:hypothetical protein
MSGYTQWVTGIARRSDAVCKRWARALGVGALAGSLLFAGLGSAVPSALAASATTVNLGQAATYAVLSGASVGNTVNGVGAPYTTLRGDLGVSVNSQPTGFPPGLVTGATRVGTGATPAYTDLVAAYNDIVARTGGTVIAGDLIGLTLPPGLYSAAGAVSDTGTLTLDGGGDPNAVFVFQIGGALNLAAGAQVTLTNGAQASNVFWQVNGAAAVGANAMFSGTILAHDAIAVGAGSEVNGRALALTGAISLNSDEFYSAPPTVTVADGATAITNNATPTISGTTDLEAPGVVTVTIAGKVFTATPSGGAWSVSSTILANGTYPVVASVIDGAGNTGSATQQLTINTVPPVVTITGGSTATTNDVDPTITGTSNASPGTTVTVSVARQTMTTLLQANGTWNTTPAPLGDGTWAVVASAPDPAGNVGSAKQTLTITTGTTAGSGGSGPTGATTAPTSTGLRLTVSLSTARIKIAAGKPVRVPFVINAPAKVTLTVMRGKAVVATLCVTRQRAGRGSLTWNGKIKQLEAPKGAYKIMIRATSLTSNSAHATTTLQIA